MLEGNRANRLVCQHTLSASKRDGPGVRHHEDVMQDLTALVLRLMRSPARARSNLGIACVAVERGGVVLAPGTHDEMGRSEDSGPVHGFLLELCCRMSNVHHHSAAGLVGRFRGAQIGRLGCSEGREVSIFCPTAHCGSCRHATARRTWARPSRTRMPVRSPAHDDGPGQSAGRRPGALACASRTPA